MHSSTMALHDLQGEGRANNIPMTSGHWQTHAGDQRNCINADCNLHEYVHFCGLPKQACKAAACLAKRSGSRKSLERSEDWTPRATREILGSHCVAAVCREQCPSLRPIGQHSQELLQRQGTLHAEERQVDQVRVSAVQGCPQCPLLLAQAQQQWHLQHGS